MSARLLFFLLLLITCGCKKFEYNPYQSLPPAEHAHSPKLNEQNLEKLLQHSEAQKDTLSILLVGDSQRFYESLDRLVKRANSLPHLDMLILAGDITDFGLLKEFEWIIERLGRLKAPYFCVIGNHDIAADGGNLYESFFGPRNFSFSFRGYRFLFHDTNGREYGFNGSAPDLNWLRNEMDAGAAGKIIGISHVPPYSDDFDPSLKTAYKDLFASSPNFILSLHGHLHDHKDDHYYNDHVRYVVSYAMDEPECVLIQLVNGKIYKDILSY